MKRLATLALALFLMASALTAMAAERTVLFENFTNGY